MSSSLERTVAGGQGVAFPTVAACLLCVTRVVARDMQRDNSSFLQPFTLTHMGTKFTSPLFNHGGGQHSVCIQPYLVAGSPLLSSQARYHHDALLANGASRFSSIESEAASRRFSVKPIQDWRYDASQKMSVSGDFPSRHPT
ncbi:hypothetical protein C8R43DRAFT_952389 [Mycena crocata]|nr:hypothetical protein C8R43DRAFT_952389 [Mycena crocata]